MKLEITAAENGLILGIKCDGEEDIKQYVFNNDEQHNDNLDSLVQLFDQLKEHLATDSSRYSDRRLYSLIMPGDKSEKFTEEHADLIWPELKGIDD